MTSQKGILSIDLIPAAADYVAYMGLSFAVSDHIVVSCTPATVTRVTQPTTCTASSSNANLTLQLQQWRFVGGSNGSIRVNETTQSTTWAGMLAVGGTVEAIGTLSDGASVDGLAVVGVTPRNWAAMPADVTVFETTSLLPERPSRIGELGNIDLLPTTGRATLEGRTAQVPANGPNAGVYYLTAVPIKLRLPVQVNRLALSEQSDFWRRQSQRPRDGMCGRDSVVPFIAVVEKHEGLNFEPGSHAERFRTRLNQIAGPATEGVVGATLDELDLWATDAIYPVLLDARAEGAKADDPGNRPVYCTFRYFQKSR